MKKVFLALIMPCMLCFVFSSSASAAPPLLINAGGRVLGHPKIHNLFMSYSWDSDNPTGFSKKDVDDFTTALVGSGYLEKAAQYGIAPASFTGSDDALAGALDQGAMCLEWPSISPTMTISERMAVFHQVDFLDIMAWLTCMTQPSPLPFLTLTGVPAPDDDTLHVVYVPSGIQIWDGPISTCGDYNAYHFFSEQATWQNGWGACLCGPVPEGPWCCAYWGPLLRQQTFAYAVVPVECANGNFDNLSYSATHEILEAATDPIIPTGWIDWNTLGFNRDLVTEGEAADICATLVRTPVVRMTNGLVVAPYWSNADQACFPLPPADLTVLGIATNPVSPAPGENVSVTVTVKNKGSIDAGHFYLDFYQALPTGVNPNPPGDTESFWCEWSGLAAGTATTCTKTVSYSAAGNYNMWAYVDTFKEVAESNEKNNEFGPQTISVSVKPQYQLTTSVPSGGGTISPDCSGGCWYNSGVSAQLFAVPSSGFVFDSWSGDCSGAKLSTSVVMNGYKSCTASFFSCADQPVTDQRTGMKYSTLGNAYGDTTHTMSGDTIQLLATNLSGMLDLNRNISVELSGGWSCGLIIKFPSSYSLIQGFLMIDKNSLAVIVEDLIIY